jgi:dinuclear metal center YbgI/SA1388 family protein
MISRNDLETYLREYLRYEDYEDYCYNGLQVEGRERINKVAFAVSYNLLTLREAIAAKADALIVHHGIFGKDFFHLSGREKDKVKMLLDADISLFGIHLPLDAHRELGNNAQLAACIGADIIEPFEVGFLLQNTAAISLEQMLYTFHEKLGTSDDPHIAPNGIMPGSKYGIQYLSFGPEIPQRIACVSGGSGSYYEAALAKGADTFIGGDIREQIPAIAFESKSNYLNIGHYWSETTGVKALQRHLEEKFGIETTFITINNRI